MDRNVQYGLTVREASILFMVLFLRWWRIDTDVQNRKRLTGTEAQSTLLGIALSEC